MSELIKDPVVFNIKLQLQLRTMQVPTWGQSEGMNPRALP